MLTRGLNKRNRDLLPDQIELEEFKKLKITQKTEITPFEPITYLANKKSIETKEIFKIENRQVPTEFEKSNSFDDDKREKSLKSKDSENEGKKMRNLFKIIDDFLNGLDDLDFVKKPRKYNYQTWVKEKELVEFLDVYLYNCLEVGIVWNSYYKDGKQHFFKCGDKTCSSRLKIIVNEESEEKKESEEEKEEPILSTALVKEKCELKVPHLEIFISQKHKDHDENYKKLIQKRLKGKRFKFRIMILF